MTIDEDAMDALAPPRSARPTRDRFVLTDVPAITGTWIAADIDRLSTRALELGVGP